jgi:hypothetical protein
MAKSTIRASQKTTAFSRLSKRSRNANTAFKVAAPLDDFGHYGICEPRAPRKGATAAAELRLSADPRILFPRKKISDRYSAR